EYETGGIKEGLGILGGGGTPETRRREAIISEYKGREYPSIGELPGVGQQPQQAQRIGNTAEDVSNLLNSAIIMRESRGLPIDPEKVAANVNRTLEMSGGILRIAVDDQGNLAITDPQSGWYKPLQ
ncbi:MAG: hypothetical protein U9R36_01235, partial [Elusimicrobiota bacterium]|nr:hypothetical protein [Elusimicrobiota bacterium]